MDKLIANLEARFSDLSEEDIALSVETIINAMRLRLISGGRIELRGFGTFRLNNRLAEKYADHMFDSDEDERSFVLFKPGHVIRERIHGRV